MRNKSNWLVWGVIALVMVAMLATAVSGPVQVQAAPAAAPTPVSVTPGADPAQSAVFWQGTAVTADGGSTSLNLMQFEKADVQYVIDQGTTNTVTLKLQHSIDGTNWTDGTTLVSNNAADAAGLNQYLVYGRFTRVYADVTNTNPVTVSVYAVAR